jgi:hypothetical protein
MNADSSEEVLDLTGSPGIDTAGNASDKAPVPEGTPNKKCSIDACHDKHHAKSLCRKHYKKLYDSQNKTKIRDWRIRNKSRVESYNKKYYQNNKEKLRKMASQQGKYNKNYCKVSRGLWIMNNRSKIREINNNWKKNNKHKLSQRFNQLKNRAKHRNIYFDLTLQNFEDINKLSCHYCSGPLPRYGSGMDRIDNNKGYVVDNIIPCCTVCNLTRGDRWSVEETKAMIAAGLAVRNKNVKAA